MYATLIEKGGFAMAKVYERQEVYQAATIWKEQCLIEDGSLLTHHQIWTKENLLNLKHRLVDTPLYDKRSFDEKLKLQLADAPQPIYQLAMEVLVMYYLFPTSGSVRYETKIRKLKDVAVWGQLAFNEEDAVVQALQLGIGATGTFYNTAKYDEVLFFIQFALSIKYMSQDERQIVLRSPWELKNLIVQTRQLIGKNVQTQHIISHLLAPDYYEAMASNGHKQRIVEAFQHYLKHEEEDLDRQLYDIRQALDEEAVYDPINYYDNMELYQKWNQGHSAVQDAPARYEATISITLDGLVFDDEGGILRTQIETALRTGKHIIFTGPPGTGKSKLATLICTQLQQPYELVTASANWTAYDTIGGYKPQRNGELYFDAGLFLKTLKPLPKWLIIDEINRANIDQAFGPLFSVLAGDSVTLPYEAANGQQIRIMPMTQSYAQEHEYIVPPTWRMIATMNTIDKASLFELSYAFMRRFAFIPVSVPKNITASLMTEYLSAWNIHYQDPQLLATLWQLINKVRKVGPAIIEDIVCYITTGEQEDVTSALILYVLPQFEGIAPHTIQQWLTELAQQLPDIIALDLLQSFCEDFFQMEYFNEA